jgi:hypothetical protein
MPAMIPDHRASMRDVRPRVASTSHRIEHSKKMMLDPIRLIQVPRIRSKRVKRKLPRT